jgi:hypothetical protein
MDGLFWVVGLEDVAAGYEDVCACFSEAGGIFGSYAAIDLDEGIKAPVVYHTAEGPDLLEGMGDEFLAAEARVDAHDQDSVDIVEDVAKEIDGGTRVDGDAGLHAEAFYLLNIPVDVAASFEMDGELVGTGLSKGFGIAFRFFDHEVNVAYFGSGFADLCDDGEAEADIGDEPAVHDIEVEPVRVAFVQHFTFIFESKEVRGE